MHPWRCAGNFTGEVDAHSCWKTFAEQPVHWQEQGSHVSKFQHARFERAAQKYDQATRDEVHVGVAETTEISTTKMKRMMGVLGNQEEQTSRLIKLRH